MTNEEKKAILYMRRQVKIRALDLSKWQNGIKVLLNLIEKQSKEIESLKEDNKKKSIAIIEYQDLYEKLKDKIKAKIEEVDYNDIGNFERRCKQEVLQSLLEKE